MRLAEGVSPRPRRAGCWWSDRARPERRRRPSGSAVGPAGGAYASSVKWSCLCVHGAFRSGVLLIQAPIGRAGSRLAGDGVRHRDEIPLFGGALRRDAVSLCAAAVARVAQPRVLAANRRAFRIRTADRLGAWVRVDSRGVGRRSPGRRPDRDGAREPLSRRNHRRHVHDPDRRRPSIEGVRRSGRSSLLSVRSPRRGGQISRPRRTPRRDHHGDRDLAQPAGTVPGARGAGDSGQRATLRTFGRGLPAVSRSVRARARRRCRGRGAKRR